MSVQLSKLNPAETLLNLADNEFPNGPPFGEMNTKMQLEEQSILHGKNNFEKGQHANFYRKKMDQGATSYAILSTYTTSYWTVSSCSALSIRVIYANFSVDFCFRMIF